MERKCRPETPPVADFTWSPQSPGEGASVQFTNLSTSGSGEIQSWDWNFAGLGMSSNQHPSFTFTENGNYNICLTVTGEGTPYTVIDFNRNGPFPRESGYPWPRGDVTFAGVPFHISETEPSVWHTHDPYGTGPNPRSLDIPVNEQGVSRVYTVINTVGGQPGPSAYAWLEFWGDGGAYFRKDLVGNVDIRDHNLDGWTNNINGTTTINVFLREPGIYDRETRLDMQIIDLPTLFLNQTLTMVRLSDNGDGNFQRVFLTGITVQTPATGSTGNNTDTVCQEILVSNVAPTVGTITAPIDPVAVNTAIHMNANFSDPGTLDTHTAIWDWGDGSTSAGVVTESNGAGSVSNNHSYLAPGVYTVKLTVTDNDGDMGESVYQYVVVYNPDGGFVTGGGWISSPAGAYIADPVLTGKANFGFNAKYKNGANVPDGNTEFQFKVANLNFKSTSYEWLVVAGAHAKFKGVGTINGSGTYGFMLTATDGQVNGGGGIDKFRIKIWDKNNGDAVAYDNQMGQGDDSYAGTTLGGGSIVIHKGGVNAASIDEDTNAQSRWVFLPLVERQ